MKPLSERQEYIQGWLTEADHIIRNVFWDIQDEILFQFFRDWVEQYYGAFYDKYRPTTPEYNEFIQRIKTIDEFSFVQKITSDLFGDLIQKKYTNPNILAQFAKFQMALADRMDGATTLLTLEQKLESYYSQKVGAEKQILLAKQSDQGIVDLLQPWVEYLNIQIAETERLLQKKAIPKNDVHVELCFFIRNTSFSDRSLTTIADYLATRGIIRDRRLFIDFLSSRNVLVAINPAKTLLYVEAIKYLYQERGVIKLNKGKQYLRHTLTHIEDFSPDAGKSTVSQVIAGFKRKHPISETKLTEMKTAIGLLLK